MSLTATISIILLFMDLTFGFDQSSAHTVALNRRSAIGYVRIFNNLNTTVHAWSVSDTVGEYYTLSANGGSFFEQWRLNEGGGGISIKLATQPDKSSVLQFEYTKGYSDSTIFWDLSAIDLLAGSDFVKHGFSAAPSQPDQDCRSVNCQSGDEACTQIYLQPKDDHATHACPIETTFEVHLGN